jgi:hypothetical protein
VGGVLHKAVEGPRVPAVFIYLIADRKGMYKRTMERAGARQQQLDDHLRRTAARLLPRQQTLSIPGSCLHERLPGGV